MTTKQKQKSWHSLSVKEVFKLQSTNIHGLTEGEVGFRIEKYGENVFKREKHFRFLKLLLKQLKSPLVLVLIVAGFITVFFGSYADSIVIFITIVINTAIGIFQEGKASQAFAKLRDSQKKHATVIRGERKQVILAKNVVPGDILVVSAGDQIAADARIVESTNLEINEAALTGEWLASNKSSQKVKEDVGVPERFDMLWMGTFVTEGIGTAIVVATGFSTEVGKIAQMIGETEAPPTSFQKGVKKLARMLTIIILVAIGVIFTEGMLTGSSAYEMLYASIAIAVAAIPEGLPVAVSVVLAMGMSRILAKGGLVKKMNAAETLGSVDIILTDKTGTLTQAVMRVSDVVTLSSAHESRENNLKKKNYLKDKNCLSVLEMAVLSSDAYIENPDDKLQDWSVVGRPIEQSVVLAGIESGMYQHILLKEKPRIDFLPFDSARRFSASLNGYTKDKSRFFISGAPEYVMEISDKIYDKGKVHTLTKSNREVLVESLEKYTSGGERAIAVAYKDTHWKEFPKGKEENLFEGFIFGGIITLHDPLRPDVPEALKKATLAGIRTVMVTGDHKKTAKKIAEEVGIYKENDILITGTDVEKMDEKVLIGKVAEVSVFSRVLPHQKLRIVRAWQSLGKTVAMTGDGINDAPSLKRAEIGIALNSGTEVAKEASAMILLNNSFSVIISAIEEGRRLLMNLRKILVYLLSTGFSEIVLIAVSLAVGLPLPVLPAQILWANLIEEGFMNFAFAFEPKEKWIMRAKPSMFSSKRLLTKINKQMIVIMVFFTSLFLIGLFLVLHLILKYPIEYTRTIMFGALSIDSIFFSFSLKNFKKPIWKINLLSNRYLIVAVFISIGFLFAALYVPQLRFLLTLEKLSTGGLLIILGAGALNLVFIEITKHYLLGKKIAEKHYLRGKKVAERHYSQGKKVAKKVLRRSKKQD